MFEQPLTGGGENLLEDVWLHLVAGHRYGLIGRNGKGKSTLLRWVASRRAAGLPQLMSIHYVAQVPSQLSIDVIMTWRVLLSG